VLKLREIAARAGCLCKVEKEVWGKTSYRRRLDVYCADTSGRQYAIEAKIVSAASIADWCLGQALIKAHLLEALPACAFPSDAWPDLTFTATAADLGVTLISERSFAALLQGAPHEQKQQL
jgi:hypothetical protein